MSQNGLKSEYFTLKYRPIDFYDDEMDFSFLFRAEALQMYYEQRFEPNKIGWMYHTWLWSFLWAWVSVYGQGVRIPVEKLGTLWTECESPITSIVALDEGNPMYQKEVRELVKTYTNDKEKWKW